MLLLHYVLFCSAYFLCRFTFVSVFCSYGSAELLVDFVVLVSGGSEINCSLSKLLLFFGEKRFWAANVFGRTFLVREKND